MNVAEGRGLGDAHLFQSDKFQKGQEGDHQGLAADALREQFLKSDEGARLEDIQNLPYAHFHRDFFIEDFTDRVIGRVQHAFKSFEEFEKRKVEDLVFFAENRGAAEINIALGFKFVFEKLGDLFEF